jgi:hypothetical protein
MIPAVIAETPSYTGLRVGAVVALRVTKMFFLDELVKVSLAEASVALVLVRFKMTVSLDSIN